MAEGKVDLWEINPLRTVDGECMICSGKGHGYGLIATVLDENDAKLIITAVNTYPSVEGLVKALEAICDNAPTEEPHDNCDDLGYFSDDPDDHYYLGSKAKHWTVAEIARSALSRFRSLQNGGVN